MKGGVNGLPLADRLRLIRGAEHLVRLGPTAILQFLLEGSRNPSDLQRRLDEYGPDARLLILPGGLAPQAEAEGHAPSPLPTTHDDFTTTIERPPALDGEGRP